MNGRARAILAAALVLLAAPAAQASVEAGKALFAVKGCGGCHKIGDQGGSVGPELTHEGRVPGHDHEWQVRHLLDPASVTPGSFMPKLMQNPKEAGDLADYLVTLGAQELGATGATGTAGPAAASPSGSAPAASAPPAAAPAPASAATPPATAPSVGSAERGQALFTAKGCTGCHMVRGAGGTMGPDLTFEGEVAGHDPAWHHRHLADPRSVSPGSTMPAFNLTPQEADDLVAFLTGLQHGPEDRALTPQLERRFAALKTTLDGLEGRIARAHTKGRNVDDLNVQLSQARTHTGTVDEMVRKQSVVGAAEEIAAADEIARKVEQTLDTFGQQLRERAYLAAGVVVVLLLGSWIILLKVRLLTLEWNATEAEREARRRQGRRGPAPAGTEGKP